MSQRSKTWIGVDPGDAGNFGLAILEVGGNCHSTTVDSADEAIAVVREFIDDTPAELSWRLLPPAFKGRDIDKF